MAKLKLNKKLIEEASKLIAAGNYVETTCRYLGISKETWYRWFRTGEQQKKGIFRDFYDAIKKAEAAAEARNVAIIQEAAKTTWQAAAWFLERKYPERWGKKEIPNEVQQKQQQELLQRIQSIVEALKDEGNVQQETEGICSEGQQ